MTTPEDQFEITAHPRYAAEARERVRAVAASAGLTRNELDDLEIAVGEAVTNAILYGSPSAASRIVITCGYLRDLQEFHVEVRDQGRGFNPDRTRDDDTELLGGRGIRLMRALMDAVDLENTGAGMAVRFVKRHTGAV